MELLKVALQIVLPRAARNDVGPLHYFKTSRIWKKKKTKKLSVATYINIEYTVMPVIWD